MAKSSFRRLRAPLPHIFVVLGLTILIYPFAASWVWDGWIAGRGFYDFAGGAVIHLPIGICALMASLIIGPRADRIWGNPPPTRFGRTLLLGIVLIVAGLFAYNPASMLDALSENGLAGKLLVNGMIAALAGALAVGLLNALFTGEWTRDATLKGILAGLAGIAAGSAWVNPLGAAFIGVAAGLAARLTISAFEVLRIDDRLDTFAIHGIGGTLGTLSAGLFLSGAPSASGLLMGGPSALLFNQFIGVVAIALSSGVTATVLLFLLDAGGLLRWSTGAMARQAARQAYEAAMAEDAG